MKGVEPNEPIEPALYWLMEYIAQEAQAGRRDNVYEVHNYLRWLNKQMSSTDTKEETGNE